MASKSTVPDLGQLAAGELRALVAELLVQLQALREENAALKAEVARLKGLTGRAAPSCGRPGWSRRPRRRAGHAARHGGAGAAPRPTSR